MTTSDPYNDEVRECFENPVHAADLNNGYAEVLVADVSESAEGSRLVLSAAVVDGMIVAIRFRVWGCPHLIAAAEIVCREHEGEPVEGLADIRANELLRRLAAGAGKTGRLLLLEDAARSLLKQHHDQY